MSTLACPENLFTDSTLEKQCFPSSKDVTFGDVLAKLAKHCAPFQKLLTNGQRVEKVNSLIGKAKVFLIKFIAGGHS
jgi:hypothetical protein